MAFSDHHLNVMCTFTYTSKDQNIPPGRSKYICLCALSSIVTYGVVVPDLHALSPSYSERIGSLLILETNRVDLH